MAEEQEAAAKTLRLQGLSYAAIAKALQLSPQAAWKLLNRERFRATCRESSSRYRARNSTALCDFQEPKK